MPRKPKTQPVSLRPIPAEQLEQSSSGPMTAEAIDATQEGADRTGTGRWMNRHLGYPPASVTNQRNGKGVKTVLTEDGPIRIEVSRKRDGSFEPLLIPKHERLLSGFDDKIVAVYARGMTVREIQGFPRR